MIPSSGLFMQMKRKKTIWSTAVAAAATTTTVFFCSPSSGNTPSRNERLPFASALATNAGPMGFTKGGAAKSHFFGSAAAMQLSLFSTALSASGSCLSANVTLCQESEEDENVVVTEIPFDESVLTYDHYNGVTIHLEKLDNLEDAKNQKNFATRLNDALAIWKAEGRRGIWIHTNARSAKYIPDCIEAGFQFHKILPKKSTNEDTSNDRQEGDDEMNNSSINNSNNSLVLSRWLPTDTPSRLPHGPTHQVGVGVILLNPSDPSQMLVVKELTGPAAKYNLWKMPTGLVDPQEYVPEAASRELLEETGIEAKMSGILCIRQAHRSNADTSDMFFVCKMTPLMDQIKWKRQEAEIAEIRWMPVKEYCDQNRWQGSPLYETLNNCVLKASMQEMEHHNQQGELGVGESHQRTVTSIEHRQLEVGFGRTDGKSEALFLVDQRQNQHSTSITTTDSKL